MLSIAAASLYEERIMIAAAKASSTRIETARGDVRTIHRNKTWEQFKHLQKGFENSRGIRLFYFDGIVEILMPGKAHELFKSVIGFLLETLLFSQRIGFEPTGSMTQEVESVASVEADESYVIQGRKLSVEVNFTSGDVSKLDRYRAIGIDEVWIWEDGVLEIYCLEDDGYRRAQNSSIPALARIDSKQISDCILLGETDRIAAAETLLKLYI